MTQIDPNTRLYLQESKRTHDALNGVKSDVSELTKATQEMALILKEFVTKSGHLEGEVERVEKELVEVKADVKEHDRILQRNNQKWVILGAVATLILGFFLSVVKPIAENRVTNDQATTIMREVLEELRHITTP